jgi:hypothetical protein
MDTVRSRVPATSRRHRWQIGDWWSLRSAGGGHAGYLVAAATGALSVAVLSATGIGALMVGTIRNPEPIVAGPAAQAETTAAAAIATSLDVPEEPATVVDLVTPGTPPVEPTSLEARITTVVGSILEVPTIVDPGEQRARRSGVLEVIGLQTEAAVEFVDDPRLSGTQRSVVNERRYEGGGSVATGTLGIDNGSGSWVGTLVSGTPPGRDGSIMQAELVGSGDYAGLSATIRYDLGLNWGDPAMIMGIVYPGPALKNPGQRLFKEYDLSPGAIAHHRLGKPGSVEMSGAPAPLAGSIFEAELLTLDNSVFDDADPTLEFREELMWFDLGLDDTRLTINEAEAFVTIDQFLPPESGSLLAAAIRARNEDGGGWSGSMRGFGDPGVPPLEGAYYLLELTGQGAYSGVSAILFASPDRLTETGELRSGAWSVQGILVPDQVLPYPEGT